MNALDVLKERGLMKQCSDEEGLRALFTASQVTYYAGFDPTAESFHVGSLIPMMAMAHLQRLGHKPIAIIGGGTGLIGDPSGKTELRKMLSREDITHNMSMLSLQFNRYLSLDGGKGLLVDNAEWIAGLNYIEFLRDIGRHFKVNEMIKNEGYKMRLEQEQGLSFIEFNYQLLQAYDFLILMDRHGCTLQMGGDDQWGNILAGVDLVRKMRNRKVIGLTFPLITTASGHKMGKTESGAIWLDAKKTSPYDFYQYWINCDDRDVVRFLLMFTFLEKKEIDELGKLEGSNIRKAKEVLAFESTKLCHGEQEATKARETSRAAFSKEPASGTGLPTTTVAKTRVMAGIPVIDILVETKLAPSRGAAKRLIEQGGAYVNDVKIDSVDAKLTESCFPEGVCKIRHGKKSHHRLMVE